MSQLMPYAMRRLMVACLLAAGLAACNPPPRPECVSNDECDSPREVCLNTVCVPAPDAAVVRDADPPDAAPQPDLDVGEDATPDAAPDAAPDMVPDAAPDMAPDAAPDMAPDAAPDMAPDAAPDACLAEELCNGEDDDCDGETDEDFPLGEACAVGDGVCAAESAYVCGNDGEVVCPIQPAEPGVETCDGTDEDCDGTVDETFAGQGDACAEGVGACLTEGVVACVGGAQACVDAEGAAVVAGQPGDEACNSIDDDCDGGTDEDFPLGDACEEGQGVCLAAGVWICGGDGDAECDAVPSAPGDEVCNGLDDDCDGEVDDVPPTPCIGGTGACEARGDLNCVDGELVCDAIAGAPAPEACNELDDDCDGRSDERLGHPCHPFVLRGGRVTWAAGTSLSADRQWRLEGRGVALDGRTMQDGANQFRLTGGVLKTVGGLEMEGQ